MLEAISNEKNAAAVPATTVVATVAAQGAMVILPHGLEIKDVEAIHRNLSDALDTGQPLTIDLSHVAAVDTAGIQLLLALQTEAKNRGTPLTFAGHSTPFRQAISVLGLLENFAEVGSRV